MSLRITEWTIHNTEYIAHMHQLKYAHMHQLLVNTSNSVPFAHIAIDQALEHLNKVTKGQGDISGITTSLKVLLKFCLRA